MSTTSPRPPSTSPQHGKMVHIVPEWDERFNREWIDTILSIAKDAGFTTVRVDCRWSDVEKEKGTFVFRKRGEQGVKDYSRFAIKANELGLKIWFVLYQCPQWANGGDSSNNGPPQNMDDFANFAYQTAEYFKPGGGLAQEEGWDDSVRPVTILEIWNEPNGGLWEVWDEASSQFVWQRQPERFAEMCNKGLDAIRRSDPEMLVMSGALCQGCHNNHNTAEDQENWKKYMKDMFAAGFEPPDIFGLQGYYGGGQDGLTPQQQMNPVFEFARKNLDDQGFEDTPIWAGEIGCGSIAHGNIRREQFQADTVRGLYEIDLPYWRKTFNVDFAWTLLVDQNNNYNTGFTWGGLMAWPPVFPVPEEQKKRAYDVMKTMSAYETGD